MPGSNLNQRLMHLVQSYVVINGVKTVVAKAGFSAKLTEDQAVSDNVTSTVKFNVEEYDVGDCYDTVEYKWTPPNGLVFLNAQVEYDNLGAGGHNIYILKNGETFRENFIRGVGTANSSQSLVVFDYASGTDYYQVQTHFYNGSCTKLYNNGRTYFSGVALG